RSTEQTETWVTFGPQNCARCRGSVNIWNTSGRGALSVRRMTISASPGARSDISVITSSMRVGENDKPLVRNHQQHLARPCCVECVRAGSHCADALRIVRSQSHARQPIPHSLETPRNPAIGQRRWLPALVIVITRTRATGFVAAAALCRGL